MLKGEDVPTEAAYVQGPDLCATPLSQVKVCLVLQHICLQNIFTLISNLY